MNYKYAIESLKKDQGSLIDRKREIEHSFCLGQITKEDYNSIRQSYEDRYKELEAVISKLEKEPKIDIHVDPNMISSITVGDKMVSFKFDDLEKFLQLSHIDQIPISQTRVKMAFEHMLQVYQEYGIDAFKSIIPQCAYDERFGYIIKLDESVVTPKCDFELNDDQKNFMENKKCLEE